MPSREEELDAVVWGYFRKITPEILAKFLFERGVPTVSCPVCHSIDISVPRATEIIDGAEVTYVHPSKIENFGYEPRASLLQYHYRLICKNCGFEIRFAVNPVFLWLQEKEKNGDKF